MSAQAARRVDPSTIVSTGPGGNYEVVGEVRVSSAADIAVAVCQARAAQPAAQPKWQARVAGRVKALGQWCPYSRSTARKSPKLSRVKWAYLRRRRMVPPAGRSITCAGGQPLERRARKPTTPLTKRLGQTARRRASQTQQHLTPLDLK
jgi:hypothetical protein